MADITTLTLKVTNSEKLSAGLSAVYSLKSDQTITIGADKNSDWILSDFQGEVAALHCQISFIDGQFVVEDCCGRTRINGSTLPIGKNKKARLAENNLLMIGPYHVRVHYVTEQELNKQSMTTLDQQFDLDEQLSQLDSSSEAVKKSISVVDEPLKALEQLDEQKKEESDDLEYLLAKDQQWNDQTAVVRADSDYEFNSAIALKKGIYHRGKSMSDTSLRLIEEEIGHDFLDSELMEQIGQPYDTGESILRGLGMPAHDYSLKVMAEEVATALQAAIRGLLELHQQVEKSRYEVMNKNLQPIEDNPLRLGLSYEETLRTLFSANRSQVHLSSTAAIEESLRMVGYHNEAVQTATVDALRQILYAFSPDVLLRRFMRYRRPGTDEVFSTQSPEWAWNMYRQYYDELISERQQGFEKLFWEIFGQAYDKTIRQKQMEG